MSRWSVALGLAVLGAVVLAVGVVVILTSSSRTALLDLEQGDCFDFPTAATDDGSPTAVVELVDVIDCTDPHDAEVVAVGTLNADGDRAYPPDTELFAAVDARCSVVEGVPRDAYGVLPIAPTEESWNGRDGRFLCVAVPFGGAPTTQPIGAG